MKGTLFSSQIIHKKIKMWANPAWISGLLTFSSLFTFLVTENASLILLLYRHWNKNPFIIAFHRKKSNCKKIYYFFVSFFYVCTLNWTNFSPLISFELRIKMGNYYENKTKPSVCPIIFIQLLAAGMRPFWLPALRARLERIHCEFPSQSR